ncbi:transglycosylase family protein,LysM domain-containing protein [Burkholderiales bacterium JOSHI_001]|nr:transglycosylase family protein,LysM domain-containing protein [Burkholderiales bacterium JOSHI_001]
MSLTYTVRSGDTLSQIAARQGVSADALMRANGMNPALADGRVTTNPADPDRLMPGQRLSIPTATPGLERDVTVQPGDTLSGLASRWGVSLESVLAANPQFDAARMDGVANNSRGARGTWDPDSLRVGDVIHRPAGGTAPTAPGGGTTPTPPGGGGAGGSGSNAILNGMDTTGASARTARQDGLGAGVQASRTMARTDERRVMAHADLFNEMGAKYKLPPAVLAGIASRESRGGNALDRNGYGDGGHGFGIMQVDDRNGFAVKTAGGPAGRAHIDQAASILRSKLDAVQRQYPKLSEQDQLRLAVSRYNGGSGVPGNFDRGTTGGDYSADVIARSQYYASQWPGGAAQGAGAAPAGGGGAAAAQGAGLPNTSGMSEAQKFDLYAGQVQAHGDAAARNDLAAGQRVIVGLRVDTAVNANGGQGRYDDRMVLLWKDANGTKHVREYSANTEPSSRYYDKGYGADINGDGRKELGRLQEGSLRYSVGHSAHLGDVLRPQQAYAVTRDTNHDNQIGAGDKTSRSGSDYLFHAGGRSMTGSAGCQTLAPGDFQDFWSALGGQRDFSYVLMNVTPGR